MKLFVNPCAVAGLALLSAVEIADMAENITAKDLMRYSFLRLGAGHTLREAIGVLLDPHTRDKNARALIVLEPDGALAGMLTARFLLRALLPDWATEEALAQDEAAFESRLQQAVSEKMEMKIADAMNRDVPAVAPDERLPRLIELFREQRLECLPVLENGRVTGVLYVVDLFNAAARLALDTQPEGRKQA